MDVRYNTCTLHDRVFLRGGVCGACAADGVVQGNSPRLRPLCCGKVASCFVKKSVVADEVDIFATCGCGHEYMRPEHSDYLDRCIAQGWPLALTESHRYSRAVSPTIADAPRVAPMPTGGGQDVTLPPEPTAVGFVFAKQRHGEPLTAERMKFSCGNDKAIGDWCATCAMEFDR